MKFTEEKLERAFTELLGQEGFPHHLGITIARKQDEVLIEEDLQNFLLIQYASHGITINEVKSIILQLKSLSANDLYESKKISGDQLIILNAEVQSFTDICGACERIRSGRSRKHSVATQKNSSGLSAAYSSSRVRRPRSAACCRRSASRAWIA